MIAMAKLIWSWLCLRLQQAKERGDAAIDDRFMAWLRTTLDRRMLVRLFKKKPDGHRPHLCGDDAEAIFAHFDSVNDRVFNGMLVVEYGDEVRQFAYFASAAREMRRLIRGLYVWSPSSDDERALIDFAITNHANVTQRFRDAFAPMRDTNYLHLLEVHLADILSQDTMYPYAADAQESLQAKIKREKANHSNQGGGKSTPESKWAWMKSVLVRHIIKQNSVLNDVTCTPESLRQKAKRPLQGAENGNL
jgi:hypothetical protein